MELADTDTCILCKQIINAHVNISTSICGISKMKIKVSDHKKCKKHYEDLLKLKFKQQIIKNMIEDKALEIECFLQTHKNKI
jgi:hypothetical protein